MKITLWGTSRFTATVLQDILKQDKISVTRIVTVDLKTTYPLLKQIAQNNNIDLIEYRNITPDIVKECRFNVICSFGKIIPESIFNQKGTTFLNIHPSLLPKYRGGNPIIAAVLDGVSESGVTYHLMSKGIDEGPVYEQHSVKLLDTETSLSLEQKLADISAKNLPPLLQKIQSNSIQPAPQVGEPTYTQRDLTDFNKAHIDWSLESTKLKWHIQGYYDNPVAWSRLNDKILKIHPGALVNFPLPRTNGQIIILPPPAKAFGIYTNKKLYIPNFLQLEGKKIADNESFANGYRRYEGAVLE